MIRSGFWEQGPEDPLVRVPKLQPLTLERASEAFSHPDWLFEIKWDGFRSLVRIEQGKCRLVSRQGNDFKSFRTLRECLLAELKVRSAVLDGKIVCLNDEGKPEFRVLLFRQGEPLFDGVRFTVVRRARFAALSTDGTRAQTPLYSASKQRANPVLRSCRG